MAILGIYRNVDGATLLGRREALLKALAKANGRSSRQWNDGGFSVGEGYNFTALREELAEVQYEIHRRGLDDDSDGNLDAGLDGARQRRESHSDSATHVYSGHFENRKRWKFFGRKWSE